MRGALGLALLAGDHLEHLVGDVEAAEDIGDGERDGDAAEKRAQRGRGEVRGRERAQDDDAVIILGALTATHLATTTLGAFFGGVAIALAITNVFGGFDITNKMLKMIAGKKR